MDVSAATRNTLSSLLDEALDLEPPARAVWLEMITTTSPELARALRKLLVATEETADVLARLPALAPLEHLRRALLLHESSAAVGDEVGPYRLQQLLGRGGMADVWLAERADGTLARKVALKLPRQGILHRHLAARFTRERDILARLEHAHIARLYDAGVSNDGVPYLAMEYVDGQPVTDHCDAVRLDIRARLRLFAQVLEAVKYAHANLVIHRDLKPSNILVTADGQARLLDFGIAKLLTADDIAHETLLTQVSGRALTPGYASPEQVLGQPLTTATDVYSLGVVLYELLAGRRPYRVKGTSAAQLESAIALLNTQGGRTNAVLRWSLVSTLGYLGLEGGDRGGAEAQMTQAVDQLRGLGPQSVEYAEALFRLADAHSVANRTEQSVPMFSEALNLLERALGPRSIRLARFRYQVAWAFFSHRRDQEAESLLVRARDQRIAQFGRDHPAVASLSNRIGLVHLAAGRWDQADATSRAVRDSQANREEVFGSPRHLAAMNLAQLDLERQRFNAALSAIQQGMQLFESLPARERNRTTELLLRLRLARALLGVGRVDEVGPVVQRVEELSADLFEHAPVRVQVYTVKARLLAARGDVAGARAELGRAHALLRAQSELGPHFELGIRAAERDIEHVR